jgi:PAS domain S-box-containing protein
VVDVSVERALRLLPRPDSAGRARRLVRDLLGECRHADWIDRAELAVSELVTNGVLHAHTELLVTARCDVDGLRVEVRDESSLLPSQRHYGDQATTGRGMALVAAVTQAHGVLSGGGAGKTVWFTICDEPDEPEDPDVGALLDGWGDDLAVPPAPAQPLRRVVLPGLPPTLWLAAAQHHDALLRELALFRAGRQQTTDDLAVADAARFAIRCAVDDALAAAREKGLARDPLPAGHPARLTAVPPALDLRIEVDDDASATFAVLQDVLDEAERLATSGRLLARPGLPEVIAIRDWAAEQVISQLAGLPPSPWPGTAAERFLHRQDDPLAELDWDLAPVRDAERGAVAADDANRILAISRPLADTLGWRPEDLVGRRIIAIVPPRFREAHVAGFTRHLTTGEAHALGVPLELPVLRADGSEVDCVFFIEAHRSAGGRAVYVAWITPHA